MRSSPDAEAITYLCAREKGRSCGAAWSRWPACWSSHCSFPSALSRLTLHPSPAPLAAGFHVQFHAALGSLNPNHTAPQATGKTVTWNPLVNPLASFLWRCKLRVRDVCTAGLAYCSLSFPTGHKDAGMLWILLLGSGQEPWTVDVISWKFIGLLRLVLSSVT